LVGELSFFRAPVLSSLVAVLGLVGFSLDRSLDVAPVVVAGHRKNPLQKAAARKDVRPSPLVLEEARASLAAEEVKCNHNVVLHAVFWLFFRNMLFLLNFRLPL
jgi:hypothetical protein